MDTPQEVIVWYVLPALRKEFVIGLKKRGLKQKEIAKILGITEPAVSQYIKNKRGASIVLSEEIKKDIDLSVKKLNNVSQFKVVFQKMLRKIQNSKFLCSVCSEHTDSQDKCSICH